MLLDLDSIIFISFLALNLIVGLFYSKGIKTVKEYAIGNGTFTTSTIATTIIATYMGASFFTTAMTESYRQGLYFIIPILGEPLALIVTGWIFIPRMKEFIGHSSVAEVMGKFYGKYARVITAICGMCFATGICALQFKVASQVLAVFFNVSSFYTTAIAASIIILYSAFGGIKAVTFTDILQFFTFTAVLPIVFIAIWQDIDQVKLGLILFNSPLFDYNAMFDLQNPRFWQAVSFFMILALHPSSTLNPTAVQRINMSYDTNQARKSFTIAGLVSIIILMTICCTSVALFSSNPNLDPNQLLVYIINTYTFTGFKSLMAICIMALIMSTADSYLNSASVLFTNDIVNVLFQNKSNKLPLYYLYSSGIIIGLGAFFLALKINSLFGILMMTLSFYTPIVCAPLILSMFGFFTNSKSVLTGMGIGLSTTLLAQDLSEQYWGLPGLLTNLLTILFMHYALGKPKGFNNYEKPEHQPQSFKQNFFDLISQFKNFSIIIFLEKILPHKKFDYISIILFSILSLIIFTCNLSQTSRAEYNDAINIIYIISVAIISTICSYVLSPFLSNRKYLVGLGWILSLSWLLVVVPSLFILMHKFHHISLLMFMINVIIFALLLPWHTSLPIILTSTVFSIKLYGLFIYSDFNLTPELSKTEIQFKISSILFLIAAIVMVFLRPKQEEHVQSENMVSHLNDKLHYQEEEIKDLLTLKQTFLRNLQHETNTPITGVYSMSQALRDCYDKLTDQQRKNAIATIASSSERLISYVSNLVDVSKLTNANYGLKVHKVNLSNLAHECIRKCKKLYIDAQSMQDREIIIDIEPGIMAVCHEYYLRKSFENLVINAIQYCLRGKIVISMMQIVDKKAIEFSVKDEGIGVPKNELQTIFDPFITSSKTITPAGGRGIGLTLVKKVAEAHQGTVSAKSDGKMGSLFTLIIPANPSNHRLFNGYSA